METTYWVIIISAFLVADAIYIGIGYIDKRNDKAYKFQNRTISLCGEWNKRHVIEIVTGKEQDAFVWFYNAGPTYFDVVFSFKPIVLEAWYEKDKLKKLFE